MFGTVFGSFEVNLYIMIKNICFVFILMLGTSAVAQLDQNTLRVVGKATIKAVPEEVMFRVPLKIIDSSYLECTNGMTRTLDDLQNTLQKKGILNESIRTSDYSITENMVYEEGKRIQRGYIGNVNVMISADYSHDFIQKVLESVSKLKLNYSINFSMSEEQKEELTEIAIINAVTDAKQKAVILSKASEVQLGTIVKISYGMDSYRPEPFVSERVLSSQVSDAGSSELNLSPPLTSLFKSVVIEWKID